MKRWIEMQTRECGPTTVTNEKTSISGKQAKTMRILNWNKHWLFQFFNDIWQTAVEKQQRKKLISQSNTMLNFRVAFILQ